jgi:hypothetical protein
MSMDLQPKSGYQENEFEETQDFSINYSEEDNYSEILHKWSAPEHEPYFVSKKFYLISIMILSSIIIYALIYNSPIMAITFILIGIVGYIFLQKEPREMTFSITHEGIVVGNEIYQFDNLKSFWIFYHPPYEKKLSLLSKSSLTPNIHIPIGDEDPVEIRQLLIDFIPEEKQERNLVDIAEKFLH